MTWESLRGSDVYCGYYILINKCKLRVQCWKVNQPSCVQIEVKQYNGDGQGRTWPKIWLTDFFAGRGSARGLRLYKFYEVFDKE